MNPLRVGLEEATCAAGVQVHLQIRFSRDMLEGLKLRAGGGYRIFPTDGCRVLLNDYKCCVGSHYTEVR